MSMENLHELHVVEPLELDVHLGVMQQVGTCMFIIINSDTSGI